MSRATALLVATAVSLAACGSAANVDTTTPLPATQAGLDVFCEHYQQARDISIEEQWDDLADVAPAEIHHELVRLAADAPGESYWEDRETVEDFMKRCKLD